MYFRFLLNTFLYIKISKSAKLFNRHVHSLIEIETSFIDLVVMQAAFKNSLPNTSQYEFDFFTVKQPTAEFRFLKSQIRLFCDCLNFKPQKFELDTLLFEQHFSSEYIFGKLKDHANKLDLAITYLSKESQFEKEKEKLEYYQMVYESIKQLTIKKYISFIVWFIKFDIKKITCSAENKPNILEEFQKYCDTKRK